MMGGVSSSVSNGSMGFLGSLDDTGAICFDECKGVIGFFARDQHPDDRFPSRKFHYVAFQVGNYEGLAGPPGRKSSVWDEGHG